jgi:lipoyl(octanoyl) transferase
MNTVGVPNPSHQLSGDELWVCQLGTVPYLDAVAIQEHVHAQRLAEAIPDTLLLLEHPPVYTRGRRSSDHELPLGEDQYRARGVDVVATNRGGRVTYHGPGQLVGYPIMRIHSTNLHLRRIEAAIIAALEREGISARTRCAEGPDYTGVWVNERKIASIGVHVSRAISTHGFAVNVNADLAPFSWVIACGLPDTQMTSIAAELPHVADVSVEGFAAQITHSFAHVHSRRALTVSPEELGIHAPSVAAREDDRLEADAGETDAGETGGVETGGAETGGVETGGVETGGVETGVEVLAR